MDLKEGRAGALAVAKLDRLFRSLLDFAGLMDRARREGWQLGPGQPAWLAHEHQTRAQLADNLERARPIVA